MGLEPAHECSVVREASLGAQSQDNGASQGRMLGDPGLFRGPVAFLPDSLPTPRVYWEGAAPQPL